jgi:hypothetical protein
MIPAVIMANLPVRDPDILGITGTAAVMDIMAMAAAGTEVLMVVATAAEMVEVEAVTAAAAVVMAVVKAPWGRHSCRTK